MLVLTCSMVVYCLRTGNPYGYVRLLQDDSLEHYQANENHYQICRFILIVCFLLKKKTSSFHPIFETESATFIRFVVHLQFLPEITLVIWIHYKAI